MSTAVKEKEITETQLPNSRRIYVESERPGVRVPFREVDLNPTRNFDNSLEENPPVRVYDTSGPYGDPSIACDVKEGLAGLGVNGSFPGGTWRNTKAAICSRSTMAI